SPPARRGAPSATVMELGGKLYGQHCAQCHQADGKGSFPAWPALAGNPSVIAAEPANVIRMVLDGGFAPATAANPRPHGMPPFAQALPDNDIAMLVSYVRNSWGNQAGAVTPLDVKRTRESGAGR
ncbi:c-type cytochrome, partial [Bordetella pertussis]